MPTASAIAARAGATSSSVSVRSTEPNATRNASERFPSPTCGPRYSSNTDDVAQKIPAGSADRREDLGRGHVLVDDEGEILPHLGVRADLVEPHQLAGASGERVEIELECPPSAVELGRVELSDPSFGRARGLARVEERLARALVRRLDPGGRIDLLYGPLRLGEAAVHDAGDVPRLAPARGIRVRDLEQGDTLYVDGAIGAGRLHEARQELSRSAPSSAEIGSGRTIGPAVTRDGVYASDQPQPTRTSSTTRRSRCQRVSRPNIASRRGSVNGISASSKRAISSTRSISRRDVARAPRRDAEAAVIALEADAAEDLLLPLGGNVEAEHLVRPLGPQRHDGRLRQLAVDVGGAGPARAGELDEELRCERRGAAGEVRVDALLPAVRALGAEREPLGAPQDPDRLEVRGLEEDGRRRRRRPRSPRRP